MIVCCIFLVACSRQTENFTISKEQILREQKASRGQIFMIQGADGPYKAGPGFVGNCNSAGSFRVGELTVSYPATLGDFYEGASYINAQDKALIIIKRVTAADVSKRAEQGAAANP